MSILPTFSQSLLGLLLTPFKMLEAHTFRKKCLQITNMENALISVPIPMTVTWIKTIVARVKPRFDL